MDIANRCKYFRELSGETQESLAKKTLISRTHISQIEIGNSIPSISVLRKYLEGCGITMSEFFGTPRGKRQHDLDKDLLFRKLEDILTIGGESATLARISINGIHEQAIKKAGTSLKFKAG